MNILKPENLGTNISNLFKSLGVIGSIVLVVVIFAALYLAGDSLINGTKGWLADRKIEQYMKQAEAAEQKAQAAHDEAEQYKGAAAAYKQQADAIQNQITELQNARPELQRQTAAATRRVEAIRNQPIRPIDRDIQQRVSNLGTDLDKLYPD